jgi:hypothetical protein
MSYVFGCMSIASMLAFSSSLPASPASVGVVVSGGSLCNAGSRGTGHGFRSTSKEQESTIPRRVLAWRGNVLSRVFHQVPTQPIRSKLSTRVACRSALSKETFLYAEAKSAFSR